MPRDVCLLSADLECPELEERVSGGLCGSKHEGRALLSRGGADFVGQRLNTLFAESVNEACSGFRRISEGETGQRTQAEWLILQDQIIQILTPIFGRFAKASVCTCC